MKEVAKREMPKELAVPKEVPKPAPKAEPVKEVPKAAPAATEDEEESSSTMSPTTPESELFEDDVAAPAGVQRDPVANEIVTTAAAARSVKREVKVERSKSRARVQERDHRLLWKKRWKTLL